MHNKVVKNILRFLLLAVLQVVVFNNMQVGTFVNIFIYVGFIIFLPFETQRGLLLLLALAGILVVSSGCKTKSGSREFIPGKGWKQND